MIRYNNGIPGMTSLVELAVFVAVVDTGSFARAAGRLRLSPAMVTTHVARLEAGLGTRLLNRSTRRLDLTESGRVFLDHARGILDAVAQAEGAVRQTDGQPVGRVRIDAPASVGAKLILPLIPACRRRFPGIIVDLSLGDRGTSYRPDGADVLIRIGPAPADAFRPVDLDWVRFILVAAPSYLADHPRPERLDDLHGHDCILYSSREAPGGDRWRFLQDGQIVWLRPRPALTFNDGAAINAAAIAGAGIAQTLDLLADDALKDGRLVSLLPECCGVTSPVVMTCPGGARVGEAVRAVADFLEQRMRSPALRSPGEALRSPGEDWAAGRPSQ